MSHLEKLLVLTLVVFLPSQLAYHWWPSWSLVSGVRVDYLSPTLYFTDILVLILLIWGFAQNTIRLPKILYIFGLGAMINIYFAYSPALATYYWLRFLELFLLGIYLHHRKQQLKTVIAAGLIVAMLWSSVLAICQFLWQHSVGGPWVWLGERALSVTAPGIAKLDLGAYGFWLRAYATFPHPNALAAFILLSTLLVGYLVPKLPKPWYLLWIPMFLALIFSWSRSIFVAILALVFPWVAPIALFLPGNPASFSERWQLLVLALEKITQHAVAGVGLGNFIPALSGQTYQPVHNVYLLLWAELGLGVVVVLYFLVKTMKELLRQQQWVLFRAMVVVIGLGLVDHYWVTLHQTSLLLAVLVSQIELKSEP